MSATHRERLVVPRNAMAQHSSPHVAKDVAWTMRTMPFAVPELAHTLDYSYCCLSLHLNRSPRTVYPMMLYFRSISAVLQTGMPDTMRKTTGKTSIKIAMFVPVSCVLLRNIQYHSRTCRDDTPSNCAQ